MISRLLALAALATLTTSLPAQPVPATTADGFRVPQPGQDLPLPASHGSHPDFKIEWWYLTGHLFAADGRRFGYQATFFRSALKAPGEQSSAAFGSSHLYLTHMALTDETGRRFLHEDRLSRDGWDAYARTGTLDVRNGNWTLRALDPALSRFQLKASVGAEASWDLIFTPEKPVIRFGQDGTSRKGPAPEARSYYLTFTRLQTGGSVTLDGETVTVEGSSWMDHEIASNQLDPSYLGWDWIAIQLNDGWEIKAYLLRQADGSPSPFSALMWIAPDSTVHYRQPEAFSWQSARLWSSPHSRARYPLEPVISTRHPLTGQPVSFHFKPLLDDQELRFPGATYWEGAGRVLDHQGRETGSAYLELVGYAGPIEGLR